MNATRFSKRLGIPSHYSQSARVAFADIPPLGAVDGVRDVCALILHWVVEDLLRAGLERMRNV